MKKRIVALTVVLAVSFLLAPVAADDLKWMPKGGCELLQDAIVASMDGVDILQSLKEKKTQKQWKKYFQANKNVSGKLGEKDLDTLAAYLAINFPVQELDLPADPSKLDCSTLPPDGKTLTLEKCTLCHPIAPVMTDERSVEGWRGAYDLPPMPQAELSDKEIDTLIHYLAYNAPVSAESIPVEMKMPLPGY